MARAEKARTAYATASAILSRSRDSFGQPAKRISVHSMTAVERDELVRYPIVFQQLLVIGDHPSIGKLIASSVDDVQLDIAEKFGGFFQIRIAREEAAPHQKPVGA